MTKEALVGYKVSKERTSGQSGGCRTEPEKNNWILNPLTMARITLRRLILRPKKKLTNYDLN